MTAPDFTQDQHRSYECRVAAPTDTSKREIAGIGVPLGVEIEVWPGFREVFDPSCTFENIERAKLKNNHRTLIGVVVSHERSADALRIVGRASKVPAGDEALELARDGALDRFSIGFRTRTYEKTEHPDGSLTIRHKHVYVREFSMTDDPAYTDALVTEVRERPTAPLTEGAPTMTDTLTREQVETLLDERETDITATLTRQFETLTATLTGDRQAAPVDQRSAGDVLKAIVAGDEDTIRSYQALFEERAYTGGTTADTVVKPGWVGDLTRVFDASSGVLSRVFSTGTLPPTGNSIEFAELATNTIAVAEQENEGDDIGFGKVSITTRTAPVKTYAGGTELTRQSIERSTVGVLNTSLEALATAAGARKKAVLRAAYNTLVAAREGIAANGGVVVLGATLAASTAGHWEDTLIDAALKFEQIDLAPEAGVVSASVFKKLRSLTVAGERVFRVAEENASGRISLLGLSGDLAGLPIYLDSGQAGDKAVLVNARALRQYDSALVSLTDENIVNLSKSFAVYRYGAVAAEIPAAVIPIKLAAA